MGPSFVWLMYVMPWLVSNIVPVAFVLLFMGWIYTSSMLAMRVRKVSAYVRKWSAFWDVFSPQAAVDAKLAELARNLDITFQDQFIQRFSSQLKPAGMTDEEYPAYVHSRVDKAKSEFWHAVEVAKGMGCKVPTSYKDVLGKPLMVRMK